MDVTLNFHIFKIAIKRAFQTRTCIKSVKNDLVIVGIGPQNYLSSMSSVDLQY